MWGDRSSSLLKISSVVLGHSLASRRVDMLTCVIANYLMLSVFSLQVFYMKPCPTEWIVDIFAILLAPAGAYLLKIGTIK